MLLKHFIVGKIAHSSYLLAGEKYCAVIDPQRAIRECNICVNPHGFRFYTDVRAVTRDWDTE